MRSSFGVDWAFGVRGAVEDIVRRAFPSELRRWPILQTFDFEVYLVGDRHFVIVVRDKLSGIPAGPGLPKPFPHRDHPPVPPTIKNVEQWQNYLTRIFHLRSDDIVMVLPVHDSGRSDARADFDMFTPEDRQLWNHQLNLSIARQIAGMKVASDSMATPPVNVTYNVSGTNARININSNDSSSNIVSNVPAELFEQMIEAVQKVAPNSPARDPFERSIREMQASMGSGKFGDSYKTFMSLLADHIQVFGPILAPYLPALAKIVV